MNPFTMVVAIVLIVAIASVVRARVGGGGNSLMRMAGELSEANALRDEIDELRARIERLEAEAGERTEG